MISVFIATSGRPEMFGKMLDSLLKTTEEFVDTFGLEIVAVIDADEKAHEYAWEYGVDVIDYSPTRRGALNAWNLGLQLSLGNILVPAGDDQIFHEGWLDYALESHRERLGDYGVVGMNDLAYNGNTQLATMFLFDREYCKNIMGGVFAPPVYKYYCVDSEWNQKAKMLGNFYWDERAKVEHLHSAHGKRPVDELDLEKQGWMEEDNKTFEQRKSQGFPIQWESII